MGKLELFGQASNEKRNQRIMRLRNDFNDEKINTLQEAAKATGYTVPTVRKWAQDGDIPLYDSETGTTVVAETAQNKRQINAAKQLEHINKLSEIYNKQEAITVQACAQRLGYPASTIIAWAKDGDVPVLLGDNRTVVPFNDTNTPAWL